MKRGIGLLASTALAILPANATELSQYPAATSVSGNEITILDQNGATKSVLLSTIGAYIANQFVSKNAIIAALGYTPISSLPSSFALTGTAGGDLIGSYPGPFIAPGTVTAQKMAAGAAVANGALAPNGDGSKLQNITPGQVGALAPNGNGSQLSGITASQVGALSPTGNGSQLTGITTAQVGAQPALGFAPLAHVANATAMASITSYVPTMRDDVGFLYRDTGSSCPSGYDGYWQIQPAPGHCMRTDISRGAPITLWSAVDDDATDAAPAINAAATAMSNAGVGGRIIIPAPSKPGACFRINSGVTIGPHTKLQGESLASCLDVNFASGDAVTLTGNDPEAENITFHIAQTRTSGALLDINGAEFAHARNIGCRRSTTQMAGGFQNAICAGIDTGDTNEVSDVYADIEGTSGICLGCLHGLATDPRVSGNSNIVLQHTSAVEVQNVGGGWIGGVNTGKCTHGLLVDPTGSQMIQALVIENTNYWDISFQESALFSGPNISGVQMRGGNWVASAGSPVSLIGPGITSGTFTSMSNAAGLLLQFQNTDVDNSFDIDAINNGGSGIVLNGGIETHLAGTISQNCVSQPANGSTNCSGVAIAANISHWDWRGRIGGTSQLIASNGAANKQAIGLTVSQGSSDYYIIAGDLSGNVVGGLVDNGSGTHKLTSQILQ